MDDFQISEMIREADKDGDGKIDFWWICSNGDKLKPTDGDNRAKSSV